MGRSKGKHKPPPKARQPQKPNETEVEITPHRNLYVGNLKGMDLTDLSFRQLFEPCGEITQIELVTTANHVFGFVEFATVAEATCAIDKLHDQSGMIVKYARTASDGVSAPSSVPLKETKKIDVEADEEDEEEEDKEEEEEAEEHKQEVDHKVHMHHNSVAAHKAASRDYSDPVGSLQLLVQRATRNSSTRENIIYTVEEADKAFIARVEVQVPAGSRTSQGEPQESKNAAKKSAAQVALRDPEVHALLPPAPAKIQEAKTTKTAVLQDSVGEEQSDNGGSEDEEGEADVAKPVVVLSAKKQRQLEQAELRAKRRAKRQAAKAVKAAQVEAALGEESEEHEEEEESDTESTEGSEDTDVSENTSDEDSDEDLDSESTANDDDDDELDAAKLAARKAAIKAALAAKRATKRPAKNAAGTKDKSSVNSKPRVGEKMAFKPSKRDQKVQDTLKQENFGQTKFIKP